MPSPPAARDDEEEGDSSYFLDYRWLIPTCVASVLLVGIALTYAADVCANRLKARNADPADDDKPESTGLITVTPATTNVPLPRNA